MLRRFALVFGLTLLAGAASAEPSRPPAPETKPPASLFPIGGLAGGLVAPRVR
jgi:hypothetical protein